MTMNRYGVNMSPSLGEYSSTFGDGLAFTQSSMDSGWKCKICASTSFVSSAVGFSRSTQRKRFVSASSVGIRNRSMSFVCSLPCVVNANERIITFFLPLRGGFGTRWGEGRGEVFFYELFLPANYRKC